VAASYQHIEPELVGNELRVVVCELASRGNVRMRAESLGLTLNGNERAVLQRIKELESGGFQFEAAEGSFEMLVRRASPDYTPPFELLDFTVIVEKRGGNDMMSQATVKLRVDGEVMHTAAEGDGPVNALDQAIRKALLPHYPELAEVLPPRRLDEPVHGPLRNPAPAGRFGNVHGPGNPRHCRLLALQSFVHPWCDLDVTRLYISLQLDTESNVPQIEVMPSARRRATTTYMNPRSPVAFDFWLRIERLNRQRPPALDR
jgi:hypothetical protein